MDQSHQTTPTTPQTSSDGSTDQASTTPGEFEAGSECGWRDEVEVTRPLFFMDEEDCARFSTSANVGFHRNLEGQTIKVGICAMAKKANSKPMKEILARLGRFEHLELTIFDEQMITYQPVEEWPVVDALVAFFSTGFPLQKAIQYKNLHKPYVINDLEAQYTLKDRREVYKILEREGIAHPRYAVMNRDGEERDDFDENEDAIEVNGTAFQRPFVEKPVNAEDHNIYIYFPVSAGGGCQRLFRKVGSRSSVYSTINRVRKTGSYIYEDFMPTDGTDVKVYTVGPDYAHAEARKSPALDGKVERDKDGKEVRYPVILSSMEKMIARKVCLAFKQNVCGFDLLRTSGKSYVCDVNGFSFVKNSTKYYDDCANVLGTMIVRALAPQLHIQNTALVLGAAPEDIPVVPTTSGFMMELRCVIAVIRHGDRTPKQKMKMEVKHRKFFDLFEKYNGYKKGHLKLKKPKQLQEVLDIARDLLTESQQHDPNPEVQEKKAKLRQLKLVLEMYEFSGINRKIQLKYQPNGRPPESSDGLYTSPHLHSRDYEYPKEPSLVLILKWGGELTPAGKYQAEDLGKAFRTLYPGGQGEFETPGLGFLRLHSTFRHDLKIYASDEGRVQMTAAAFTKGLLALEGELTPILVSMVKSANTNGLLDKEGETSKYQHVVKERLMEILNQNKEFVEDDTERLAPTRNTSLTKAMQYIDNPKRTCDQVYEMVQEITAKIKTLKNELKSRDLKLYHGESWELLIRRWAKLEKDFKLKSGNYDISKIPDIYDCIKYDLQHNQKTLQFARAEELFLRSKALADIVIPQEYGITVEEKLHISQSICTPLMRKINGDLHQGCQANDEESTRLNSKYSKGVASPERFVRTRLYFTSESHIHSLLNMLRYGGLCDEVKDEQWKKAMDFLSTTPELNYMTQINIMMFEDPSKDPSSPEKFHVELHFSPGAYTSSDKNVVNPASSGYRTSFLTAHGKKPHEIGKKLLDGDKLLRSDEPGITEVMSETITEETLTEESITYDPSSSNVGNPTGPLTVDCNTERVRFCIGSLSPVASKGELENKQGTSTASVRDSKTVDIKETAAVSGTDSVQSLGFTYNPKTSVDGEKLEEGLQGKANVQDVKSDIAIAVVDVDKDKSANTNDSSEDSKDVDIKEQNQGIQGNQGIKEQSQEIVHQGQIKVLGTPVTPESDDSAKIPKDDFKMAVTRHGEVRTLDAADDIGSNKFADIEKDAIRTPQTDEDELVASLHDKMKGMEIRSDKDEACQIGKISTSNSPTPGTSIETGTSGKLDIASSACSKDDMITKADSTTKAATSNMGNQTTGVTTASSSESLRVNIDAVTSTGVTKSSSAHVDVFDEVFEDDEHSKTITNQTDLTQTRKHIPLPKSPNPDIPEWDWDDGISRDDKATNSTMNVSQSDTVQPVQMVEVSSSGNTVSKPIAIGASSSKSRNRADSVGSLKSYDEKRSRSFEEQEKGSNMDLFQEDGICPCVVCHKRMPLPAYFSNSIAMLEKHYCTIHLPIKDSHHSFSSLLYLNPEAFKDGTGNEHLAMPKVFRMVSYSSPQLNELVNVDGGTVLQGETRVQVEINGPTTSLKYMPPRPLSGKRVTAAFDGFNMVPSLKPLETLHNNLTMKDLDAFLSRATTTKFFTPANSPMFGTAPLHSPRCGIITKAKSISGPSLPSSSNSSAGPSSPTTTASTPVDFVNKVKAFINNTDSSTKPEQIPLETDTVTTTAHFDTPSSNQNTVVHSQPIKTAQSLPVVTSAQPMKNVAQPVHGKDQSGQVTCDQPMKAVAQSQPCASNILTTDSLAKDVPATTDPSSVKDDSTTGVSSTAKDISSSKDASSAENCSTGASPQEPGTSAEGSAHKSAFKLVSRSGSLKSSFHVSSVPEESLQVSKSVDQGPTTPDKDSEKRESP